MTVYVDNMRRPYRNPRSGWVMKMSHMIADTSEELHAMAAKVGLRRDDVEDEGTYREHYDVCLAKREKAISAGAMPVTQRELGRMLIARKRPAALAVTTTQRESAGGE